MDRGQMDKVQMYFEAALAIDPQKRKVFLQEQCGQDPDMLEEVLGLLMADEATKPFDNPLPGVGAVAVKQGVRIGPYQISDQIGVGGMGIIYKALDTRLERQVALKFLPPHLCNDVAQQRFMAEARAASQLDHPNICTIHDIGETSDGQMYITMPFYDGETLSKRISRGPLPVLAALDIALQVGDGLAAAHNRNIVHRDVKPANIMLTGDGGVKVLDFGVAKVADVHLTSTGMSIGTLAYMSPEQLRGDQVDGRTDVWALGVVLYEMLTAKRAFPGQSLPEILDSVLHFGLDMLETLPTDVPPLVGQVLQTAMARELGDRYNDMASLLDDLIALRAAINGDAATQQTKDGMADGKKSRSYEWNDKILDAVAAILLPQLGPIAPKLVKRMAKTASDMAELRQRLADFLPDQAMRDEFHKKMESQIAAFTSPPMPQMIRTDGSLGGVDLSATELAALEASLIAYLGPIAQTMIKRYAANASSMKALCETLADTLHTDEEKQTFIKQVGYLFG